MSRKSLHVLALVASSSILSLVLAESVLRVLPDPEQALSKHREVSGGPLHQRDPLLGWRTVPNTSATIRSAEYTISVQNNSRGIRGPEYAYAPGQHESRILVIGDSFTAGYTVQFEETFGQVAERDLNTRASRRHRVIAAGTEAYSTDQELLFFVEEGWKYRPDITVLMFFFNDIWFNTQPFYRGEDFGSKPLFRLEGRQPVLAHKPIALPSGAVGRPSAGPPPRDPADVPASLAVKRWLNDHSRLYRLVRRAVLDGFARTADPLRRMGRRVEQGYDLPRLEAHRVAFRPGGN